MTAINGTPRPVHPSRPALRTTAHTSRTRPSRRRALAVAITAALLAATSIAIDAATTATNPTSPGTSSRPAGTGATRLPNPPLGPTGIGPAPLGPGSRI